MHAAFDTVRCCLHKTKQNNALMKWQKVFTKNFSLETKSCTQFLAVWIVKCVKRLDQMHEKLLQSVNPTIRTGCVIGNQIEKVFMKLIIEESNCCFPFFDPNARHLKPSRFCRFHGIRIHINIRIRRSILSSINEQCHLLSILRTWRIGVSKCEFTRFITKDNRTKHITANTCR